MPPIPPPLIREALAEKLQESLEGPPPEGTRRRVHGATRLSGKVTAVVGMRRAGKTTFVHQLRRERLAAGASRDQLPYVNFEDERLAGLEAAHLGFLVDELARRAPDVRSRGTVTWSFDEIQTVPGWERFVRRLLDSGVEVVVTGSSAALLSREVATALRGRGWEVPLYPFGFAEALDHRGEEVPDAPSRRVGPARHRMERAFQDWLETGGFPEAQGLDPASRGQLLRDYVDVAMLRDIVERHRVTNVAALRWLVRHLIGNASRLFSVEKFHAALRSQGIAVSKDTLHELLAYVEDCFLVRTLWMESTSERQRMVNPRKSCPVDPALIPLFDRSGRVEPARALETVVLVELLRRRCEVTYARTRSGLEVDFLARTPDGRAELVQVCVDASDPDTARRELRALSEAAADHPDAKQRLLVLRHDGAPEVPPEVTVQPVWVWMLEG